MSILLTGASGFIGKSFIKKLVDKYGKTNIISLVSSEMNESSYLLHNNYDFDKDYFVNSGFSEIDTIIHLGAFIPKNAQDANNIQSCNSNIVNTEKLLLSNLPNLKKFIFISTVDVYGSNVLLINEDSPLNPVSLYGYSKLYCEKMVEAWAKSNDKICQILRLGHVYGPGEENYQKIIPTTIKNILSSQTVQQWGTGEDIRTFINVDDVSNAILKSITLNEYVGPINVTGEQNLPINVLLEKLIKLSNKECKLEKIETNIIPRHLVFDSSKLKKYLLQNQKDIDQGLLEEIKYMENLE